MNIASKHKIIQKFLAVVLSLIICQSNAQTVYNDGVALKLEAGTNVYLDQMSFTNKTNGVDGTINNLGTIYIDGNWNNNVTGAGVVFSPVTAGTVEFTGSTQQLLGGTATNPTEFNNFTANVDPAQNVPSAAEGHIRFDKPHKINGALTMTEGQIETTAANILDMQAGATATAGADSSFVKGPMKHTVNVAAPITLVYPIGKGNSWRRLDLSIDQDAATETEYTAKITHGDANPLFGLGAGLTHVSYQRYLDITPEATGVGWDLGNTVQIWYNDNGSKPDCVTDAPNLRIAKDNGTNWIDIGGSGTGSPSGDITSGAFSTFSKFVLANATTGTNPLPIELLSFTAILQEDNTVLTKWATTTEINNDYFTVERSIDGTDFEFVTSIAGAGNSNQILHYTAIDPNPYHGISYYRLKQTDYNGKYEYSDIVAVSYNQTSEALFALFPNPSDGEKIYAKLRGFQKNKEVLVIVMDIFGREHYSKVIITDNNGYVVLAIDPYERLASGTYIVTCSVNHKLYKRKLIIE